MQPIQQMVNLNNPSIRRDRQIYDGKRIRRPVVRKTVDYYSTIINNLKLRSISSGLYKSKAIFSMADYIRDMLPASEYQSDPSNGFCTKYISTSVNKARVPVNVVCWTPEGRRLITGTHSGEFTLQNGLLFNFETILQAHDDPVRCMIQSHNEEYMVTADDRGIIKYQQSNMNNVKAFQGHEGYPIRKISFCPTDKKFVSASDEGILKVWDFEKCLCEQKLSHGQDVKAVDQHEQKALIASGGKDQVIKLQDPKSNREIAKIPGHRHTVSCLQQNMNGNQLLSGSRDQLIKMQDIRKLREIQHFKGHLKEVTCLEWHPFHETMFVTGGFDGSVMFWVAGLNGPQAEIFGAHENSVQDIAQHPLGHLLCTGSSDNTTRFWARNRPGDDMADKYNAAQLPEDKRIQAFVTLRNAEALNPFRLNHRLPALQNQQKRQQETVKTVLKTEDDEIPFLGETDLF